MEATIPGCTIQSSFNQYGSYFKFILLLSGDRNEPTAPDKKKERYTMGTSPVPQL